MIIVNCPHCGNEHIVDFDEIHELLIGGKCVVTCDNSECNKLYTIEQCDDAYFTK